LWRTTTPGAVRYTGDDGCPTSRLGSTLGPTESICWKDHRRLEDRRQSRGSLQKVLQAASSGILRGAIHRHHDVARGPGEQASTPPVIRSGPANAHIPQLRPTGRLRLSSVTTTAHLFPNAHDSSHVLCCLQIAVCDSQTRQTPRFRPPQRNSTCPLPRILCAILIWCACDSFSSAHTLPGNATSRTASGLAMSSTQLPLSLRVP